MTMHYNSLQGLEKIGQGTKSAPPKQTISRTRISKFIVVATDTSFTLPLSWKTDKPIWVEQWPLPRQKLVKEQLDADYIEPSNSLRNSPVFVIKKKTW